MRENGNIILSNSSLMDGQDFIDRFCEYAEKIGTDENPTIISRDPGSTHPNLIIVQLRDRMFGIEIIQDPNTQAISRVNVTPIGLINSDIIINQEQPILTLSAENLNNGPIEFPIDYPTLIVQNGDDFIYGFIEYLFQFPKTEASNHDKQIDVNLSTT